MRKENSHNHGDKDAKNVSWKGVLGHSTLTAYPWQTSLTFLFVGVLFLAKLRNESTFKRGHPRKTSAINAAEAKLLKASFIKKVNWTILTISTAQEKPNSWLSSFGEQLFV